MNDVTPIASSSPGGGGDSPAEQAEKWSEMPLPRDLPSFLMTAILTLLVLVVLYFSGEGVLPLVFAFLLNLLFQPAMPPLVKQHAPKTIAALFINLCVFRAR